MAVAYFICSDHQTIGDQALSHVRQYYPNVIAVYCARRAGDGDRNHTDPGTLRVRSRGRHNPGSGNYFCSHIDPPGKVNGYLVGNVFYATNFPFVGTESQVSVRKASYSYSGWTSEDYSYGSNWSQYYYRTATVVSLSASTVVWRVSERYGAVRRGTYEQCRSVAFASDPTYREVTWRRGANLNDSNHIPAPTFEDRFMQDKIDSGILPNLDTYLNAAYLDAFNSLPVVKTNNIQNLFAVYDLLKALVNPARAGGRLIDGVGTIGDAWLGYRYSYTTTKSDIQELVSVVDRCRGLSDGRAFRSYGSRSVTIGNDTYILKCALTTRLTDVFGCYSELERLGLALDGYNAWDLIPYSFMVDWFLHIGNLIEAGRDWSHAMKLAPSISDSWFSITHYFTNKYGGSQCDYYRWPCVGVSAMLPATMLSHQQSSGSTWVKRGADALAIFS